MSLDKPTPDAIDGAELRFALVTAGYNGELVQALKKNAVKGLRAAGVPAASIVEVAVPGSGEIPYAAYMSAMSGDYDCVIALGVVVAGDTPHHEIIAHSTAEALQDAAIRSEVPMINGIVVTNNREQAVARCQGSLDRGTEFAHAALAMARHRVTLGARLDQVEDEERKRGGQEPFAQN
ncbi:MAG: 6,7-dimethyl-8-ribityllumazine synthase [Opitutales bacterium]|jgi:6,7-dimethyl-8-ribityllumazine synthase|nr:6,7-dimethyl-8-ribityllumazine synthase [Opitutales bacterium]MDP4658155.1 6,7-dimethyl-8-ribityllumazine synthase [Opitutales bacterium]MDP4775519.1 6,7-dimethyl-8-ribityllumazine synthase [Opitutales bacterium]MDP4786975.1 6,7-dimethyl-8-ribityllumazine synthase [Opitutales bacterium]MDP4860418.1 6,7-dimethyl-8-ribityllumazine synthase [Opitutales bacterium]